MDITELTVHELKEKLDKNEITALEITKAYVDRINDKEKDVQAFVTMLTKEALDSAKKIDEEKKSGKNLGSYAGIPIGIKDNMCTKGIKTTCSSKMLENFISPYDGTVVNKLLNEEKMINLGKLNMDEFAMGSSTETSYFKKTKNPWDLARVPGGSSGGSAAAVSAQMAYASLGSDTGGSIRQPASYCSVVGLKPTYGLVSRFGLVAFASSLDQIGPFARTVEDATMMLNVLAGHDKMDTTSANLEKQDYTEALVNDVKGKVIGIPTDFITEGIHADVKAAYDKAIETMKNAGAEIKEITLSYAKYSLATYYIVATAEASSNLGRYDGIRYGHRAEDFNDLEELYRKSRTEGFGPEVKRRIMLGTYVLSSGYYDAYYKRAQQVRTLIVENFKNAFENCDVIMIPTAPNTSFKFGEHSASPLEMYLEDIYTVPVNIAGLPGISVPGGFDSKGLPIGIQFIAKSFDEKNLLQVAYTFEQNTDYHTKEPTIEEGK